MAKKINEIVWRVVRGLGLKDSAFGKAVFMTVWLVVICFSLTVLPFVLGFWLVFLIKDNIKSTNLKYGLSVVVVAFTLLFGIPWAGAIYSPNSFPRVKVEDKKEAPKATTPSKTEPKIETVEETITQAIAFTTSTKDDPTLEVGETKVEQEGKDGTRAVIYKVTYTDSKETARTKIAENVTLEPVEKIVLNGTKVAAKPATTTQTATQAPTQTQSQPASQTPTQTTTNSDNTYTNVDGNTVASPNSDSTDASALCKDGTYSHSQHRRGTCSGHGGVAQWLKDLP